MSAGTARLIAVEYALALGIVSWSAIKGESSQVIVDHDPPRTEDRPVHYWPWPPTVVGTSVAFGILGMLGSVQPQVAGILGAGFLLAQLIRALGKGNFFELSGIPNSPAFQTYREQDTTGGQYRILTF